MVDPRFKTLHFVFFINREEGVIIVEEYNKRSLYYIFKMLSSFTFNCRI